MEKLQTTIMGLGSIGAVEVIPSIMPPAQMDYPSVVQTIVQIVIGIATLLGLFRKRKSVTT